MPQLDLFVDPPCPSIGPRFRTGFHGNVLIDFSKRTTHEGQIGMEVKATAHSHKPGGTFTPVHYVVMTQLGPRSHRVFMYD